MRLVLTIILSLGGLLFCYVGLGFLISPESQGADFGIKAISNTGIGAIRGDMAAFFLISGLSMLYGAWKRNGDILLIPAFMMGCAFVARTITFFTHGPDADFFQPMVIEAVFVVATLIGSRVLPHTVADGDDTN